MSFEIHTMQRDEVDIAVNWAAQEGWNPGLHDAECFYQADHDGFLFGIKDGRPAACISVVRYGNDFAFLGFYIVAPEFRGQGLGYEIWQAGMARLAGRNVGLDGVVDQQENYRKSGFKLAYNNMRYEGVTSSTNHPEVTLYRLANAELSDICQYDRPFFPANREIFLRHWISQPEAVVLGYRVEGQLRGYGMIRPCRSGYKIGPLFADSADMAEQLFLGLTSSVTANQPVFLDICDRNQEALGLVDRHGMTRVFDTARMYTGQEPRLPFPRLYGVTSFELG